MPLANLRRQPQILKRLASPHGVGQVDPNQLNLAVDYPNQSTVQLNLHPVSTSLRPPPNLAHLKLHLPPYFVPAAPPQIGHIHKNTLGFLVANRTTARFFFFPHFLSEADQNRILRAGDEQPESEQRASNGKGFYE